MTHNIIYLHEPRDSRNTFQGPFQLDLMLLHSQFVLSSVCWCAFPKTCLANPYSPLGPCVLLHQWACCHYFGTETQLTGKAAIPLLHSPHLEVPCPESKGWTTVQSVHSRSALKPRDNPPSLSPKKPTKPPDLSSLLLVSVFQADRYLLSPPSPYIWINGDRLSTPQKIHLH